MHLTRIFKNLYQGRIVNYIGYKFTLSSFLEESIKETLKENNSKPLKIEEKFYS